MALRLDPSIPLVWRTPTDLQLGALRPLTVFPAITHDDELLLSALQRGTTREGLEAIATVRGMPPGAPTRMLERVGGALQRSEAPRPGALVLGEGPLAEGLDRVLVGAGRGPRRRGPAPRADLVVLVAAWLVDPRTAGQWLRRDVPHLPVVIADRAVIVGPFVRPGEGPCLHCRDRHLIDRDPAWPAVAAQLLALPAPELTPLTAPHALALASRAVIRALDGELPPGRELRLDLESGRVRVRDLRRHPECWCGAPPGSDSAPAAVPDPRRIGSAPSAVRAGTEPA